MTDYFNSRGFQTDFNNLLKSLLLISKKLEDVTAELSGIKQVLNKESNTDNQLVTPPTTWYNNAHALKRARENTPTCNRKETLNNQLRISYKCEMRINHRCQQSGMWPCFATCVYTYTGKSRICLSDKERKHGP